MAYPIVTEGSYSKPDVMAEFLKRSPKKTQGKRTKSQRARSNRRKK